MQVLVYRLPADPELPRQSSLLSPRSDPLAEVSRQRRLATSVHSCTLGYGDSLGGNQETARTDQ
jgi:hypothetical protein